MDDSDHFLHYIVSVAHNAASMIHRRCLHFDGSVVVVVVVVE
jgi:hypothetical protein